MIPIYVNKMKPHVFIWYKKRILFVYLKYLCFYGKITLHYLYDEGKHSVGINGEMRHQGLGPRQQVFTDERAGKAGWGLGWWLGCNEARTPP